MLSSPKVRTGVGTVAPNSTCKHILNLLHILGRTLHVPRLLHLLDHILGQLAIRSCRCFIPKQTMGGLWLLLSDPYWREDRSWDATLDIGDDAL